MHCIRAYFHYRIRFNVLLLHTQLDKRWKVGEMPWHRVCCECFERLQGTLPSCLWSGKATYSPDRTRGRDKRQAKKISSRQFTDLVGVHSCRLSAIWMDSGVELWKRFEISGSYLVQYCQMGKIDLKIVRLQGIVRNCFQKENSLPSGKILLCWKFHSPVWKAQGGSRFFFGPQQKKTKNEPANNWQFRAIKSA